MTYNWCHGPKCHERNTTNRVRGVKGSKVLRTRKIKQHHWNKNTYWEYFCDQTCLMSFIGAHFPEFIRLHPRTEALETPILDPVKTTHTTSYGYTYTNTEIKKVDSGEQVG
jgi:hypothetical protein